MKIVYIHSTAPKDSYRVHLRCENMAWAINRIPNYQAETLGLDSFLLHTPDADAACADADILVIHRYLCGPILQAIYHWKARDKKIFVDIDQDLFHLPPGHLDYPFWMEASPAAGFQEEIPCIEQLKLGLRLVDAVTVPSARLAKEYRAYARTIIIPDALNTDEYLTPRKAQPAEIWLGIGGDEVYLAGLENSGLLPALESVSRQRPQVHILLSGVEEPPEGLLPSVPAGRKKIVTGISFTDWVQLLSTIHIGLAPIDSPYEQCWSSVRILEYMSMKIPWVASDLSPYLSLGKYGWLVKNSPDSWEKVLLEMVDHLDAYQAEASGNAFLQVLSLDIHENIRSFLSAYQSV